MRYLSINRFLKRFIFVNNYDIMQCTELSRIICDLRSIYRVKEIKI